MWLCHPSLRQLSLLSAVLSLLFPFPVVRGGPRTQWDTLSAIGNCWPPPPTTLGLYGTVNTFSTSVSFYCAGGGIYTSGTAVSQCYLSSETGVGYYWDYPPTSVCISLNAGACRTVTAVSATEAFCASNEMVVSGGGQCNGDQNNWDNVLYSAPSQSMQSWVLGCVDGSAPTSVSAQCCRAAVDTFLTPPPSVVAGTALPLSPSGSFFTSCSAQTTSETNYEPTGITCPSNKTVITGGGGCSQGPMTGSYRSSDSTWTVNCPLPATSTPPLVAICCASLFEFNLMGANAPWTPTITAQVAADLTLGRCAEDLRNGYGAMAIAHGYLSSGGSSAYSYLCVIAQSSFFLDQPVCPALPQPAIGTITRTGYQAVLTCPQLPTYAQLQHNGYVGAYTPAGSSTFYIEGNPVITCNDGQWSGQLGVCTSFDATRCISVRTVGASVLSCPSDGQQWIMMAPSVSCNTNIGLISGWPWDSSAPSSSAWSGTCADVHSESSALCCLASATPALSTCSPQQGSSMSAVACKTGQFALTAGATCSTGISYSAANAASTPAFTTSWDAQCESSSAVGNTAAVCCDLTPLLQSTCWTQSAIPDGQIPRRTSSVVCPVGSILISSSVVCPVIPPHVTAISESKTIEFTDFSTGSATYSHRASCAQDTGSEALPTAHYGTCCSAPQLCGITSPAPAHLLTPINTKWLQGSPQKISCQPGYSMDTAGVLNSVQLSCITPQTYSINCLPQSCDNLVSDPVATFSAKTAIVGSSVLVSCPAGYFQTLTTAFTCGGNASLAGSGWSPVWSGAPLCQKGMSGGNLTWAAVDHYSYVVSWVAPASLPSSVTATSLQFRVVYTLLFPAPAQVDSSNAQEAGLIPAANTVLATVPSANLSFTVHNDVNSHIEGVLAVITIQAVAALATNSSAVVVLTSSSVTVQQQCGCDLRGNPSGFPLNLSLAQSLDAQNSLSLTFTPQSLCAKDYKVQQLQSTSGSAPVWTDVALPVLQTYWAETQSLCAFMIPFSTQVGVITWQMAGRLQSFQLVPAPMAICEGCIPVYTPGSNSPDITSRLSITPLYWMILSGTVMTPASAGAESSVQGITVTLTVIDSVTGNPLVVNGSVVSSVSAVSDGTGSWQAQLSSSLLTQQYYNVLVTPSRTTLYNDTAVLVVAPTNATAGSANSSSLPFSAYCVLQVGPSTFLLYDDGSYIVTQSSLTTSVQYTYTFTCSPPVLPAGTVNASLSMNYTANGNTSTITRSSTSPLNVTKCNFTQAATVVVTVAVTAINSTNSTIYRPFAVNASTGQPVAPVVLSTFSTSPVVRITQTVYPNATAANGSLALLSQQFISSLSNSSVNATENSTTAQTQPSVMVVDAMGRFVTPYNLSAAVAPLRLLLPQANLTFVDGQVNVSAPVQRSRAVNTTVFAERTYALPSFNSSTHSNTTSTLYSRLRSSLTLAGVTTLAYAPSNATIVQWPSSFPNSTNQTVLHLSTATDAQGRTQPVTLTLYSVPVVMSGVNVSASSIASQHVNNSTGAMSPIVAQRALVHQFQVEGHFPSSPTLQVTMTHGQTYAGVTIDDLSEVSLSGFVRWGPQTEALAQGLSQCGMEGVVITAFDVSDVSFNNPLAASVPTLGDGKWSLAVISQSTVVLVPTFPLPTPADSSVVQVNHTFSPASLTLSVTSAPVTMLLFADTTTNTLTAQLLGGLCQAQVGFIVPVLVLDTCGGLHIPLPGYSTFAQSYQLPAVRATFLSYTADPLDRSGVQPFTTSTSDVIPAAYQATINTWLIRNGQASLDLTAGNQALSFTYSSPTSVKLLSPASICTDELDGTGLPFYLGQQGGTAQLTFALGQQYGYGSLASTCNHIDTTANTVWVHDNAAADTTLPCAAGCQVSAAYDGTSTTASYSSLLGNPYLYARSGAPPFTRDICFGLAQDMHPEAQVLHVLITGTYAYAGVGSLPFAPSQPLYILRDPPGGGSFATVTSTYIQSQLNASSGTEDADRSLSVSATHGADQTITTCQGFGYSVCTMAVKTSASQKAGLELDSTSTDVTGDSDTSSVSYSVAISTSADPSIVGGDGDLFLVVSSNVIFSLVWVLQAKQGLGGQCQVTPPYQSVAMSDDPNRYLSWYSAVDIRTNIIGEAQLQMDGVEAELHQPNQATNILALEQQRDALRTTITQWQLLLTKNDEWKATALPWSDLLSNIDFSAAAVPKQSLTDPGLLAQQSSFSFTGDTSAMTASVSFTNDYTASSETDWSLGTVVSADFNFDANAFGLAWGVDISIQASVSYAGTTSTLDDSAFTQTIEFTLADPDEGDEFMVQVQKDVLGFPVYNVVSGQSRCAPEPGTIYRENVTMQLTTATFNNIDPTAVVTTSLTLTNLSPFLETFPYYLNVVGETNTGGLQVTANGVPMTRNALYLTLPPGPTVVVLELQRNPGSSYSHHIAIKLTSDSALCAVLGAFTNTIDFSISYTQSCPPIEFGGDLAYSDSFVVNYATQYVPALGPAGSYVLVITNPETQLMGRGWASSGLLDPITLSDASGLVVEYQPVGSSSAEWVAVVPVAISGAALTSWHPTAQLTDVYGFTIDVSTLEGKFVFRARTSCLKEMPVGALNPSLYQFISTSKTALIDRTPPQLFNSLPALNPATGLALLRPGDVISVEMSEPVLCQSTHSHLLVQAWIAYNSSALGKEASVEMLWQCSGAFISIAFDTPDWNQLSGQVLLVQVSGMSDLALNFVQNNQYAVLTFQYRVATFNVSRSPVSSPIIFGVPPTTILGNIPTTNQTNITTPITVPIAPTPFSTASQSSSSSQASTQTAALSSSTGHVSPVTSSSASNGSHSGVSSSSPSTAGLHSSVLTSSSAVSSSSSSSPHSALSSPSAVSSSSVQSTSSVSSSHSSSTSAVSSPTGTAQSTSTTSGQVFSTSVTGKVSSSSVPSSSTTGPTATPTPSSTAAQSSPSAASLSSPHEVSSSASPSPSSLPGGASSALASSLSSPSSPHASSSPLAVPSSTAVHPHSSAGSSVGYSMGYTSSGYLTTVNHSTPTNHTDPGTSVYIITIIQLAVILNELQIEIVEVVNLYMSAVLNISTPSYIEPWQINFTSITSGTLQLTFFVFPGNDSRAIPPATFIAYFWRAVSDTLIQQFISAVYSFPVMSTITNSQTSIINIYPVQYAPGDAPPVNTTSVYGGGEGGGGGVSTGVIVGAVLGSILGCCLLVCCLVLLCWRSREEKEKKLQKLQKDQPTLPSPSNMAVAGDMVMGVRVGSDDLQQVDGAKRELYLTHHATVASVEEENMVRNQFQTALQLMETSQRLASRESMHGNELLAEPPSQRRSRSAPDTPPTHQRRQFNFPSNPTADDDIVSAQDNEQVSDFRVLVTAPHQHIDGSVTTPHGHQYAPAV